VVVAARVLLVKDCMMNKRILATLSLTTLLALGHAIEAQAQPKLEVGASLINAVVARAGNETLTTVGIPSGGFGVLNPGVYASIFLGTRMAVEPQLGLIWASADGDSFHILHFVTQFDYFFLGTQQRSPYVFATAGITDAGEDYSPKSFGAGLGYRVPMGD
jgi:hypothetical protein